MMHGFEDFVAESEAADGAGSGFTRLEGRATEDRPPWGASIADDTRTLLDQRVPEDSRCEPELALPQGGRRRRIAADGPGVLQWVDEDVLADAAQRQGVSIELLRAVGEFVPSGAPLGIVHGDAPFDDSTLSDATHFGRERSMDQDIGFGLCQLVDLAERALSPGVNDTTTAVQAIDHLHDIMRRLAIRALPARQHVTDDGHVVLSVPLRRFSDYLALAFDEVMRWGEDSPRIQRRVHVALRDLEDVARPEHRQAVVEAIARHHAPGLTAPVDALSPSDVGLR